MLKEIYKNIEQRSKQIAFVVFSFLLMNPFMANAGSQTFDGSGAQTFTVPAGVTEIIVTAAAQGGRGGAGYFDVIGGVLQGITGNEGGEGGNINQRRYAVTPGTTYPVVVNQSYLGPTSMLPLFSLTSGQDGDNAPVYGAPGYTGKGANGVPNDGVPQYYGTPGYCYEYGGDPVCDPPGDSAFGTGGLGGVAMYIYGRGATTSGGAGGAGFVNILWVDPTVGNINVYSNIPGAPFTLTGPATIIGRTDAGGNASFSNRPTGTYTITWGVVSGYATPSSSSFTLTSGSTRLVATYYIPTGMCRTGVVQQCGDGGMPMCSTAGVYLVNNGGPQGIVGIQSTSEACSCSGGNTAYLPDYNAVPLCSSSSSYSVAGSCGEFNVLSGIDCMAGDPTFMDCRSTERAYYQSSSSIRSCPMNSFNHIGTYGRCVADATCTPSFPTAGGACDWQGMSYAGTNTGNPGVHDTSRCSTPFPSDGIPNSAFCNETSENGTWVTCCDSGADCFRYNCNYPATCVTSVNLHF